MPKTTLPYARNIIRRSLFEVIDPTPSRKEQAAVWSHFGSACAYCERPLAQGKKEAHLDHLVSASAGGRNHIANRVLACASCNEHEKRKLPWEPFLREKSGSEEVFLRRRDRILAWVAGFPEEAQVLPQELLDVAQGCASQAVAAFTEQAEKLREARERSKRDTEIPNKAMQPTPLNRRG